ncbi:MAG TPA: serine/threonine-protein kinase [Planctomycetota bacterium]|nr:serine/threonine-protein kinase [Planctomycetota bacterium]
MPRRGPAEEIRAGRGASRSAPTASFSPDSSLENDEFLQGLRRDGKERVIGPVRIQSRISRGGMGMVYRGRHVKLDIDVAVKFLLPHLAENNPEYIIRFEREARIAAQLNNENLVRVFDVNSEENYHYVVMELVCGETARDRVARKGPLGEAEAVEIILGATRGLEAAHRKGIVHRDIKPENIMIDATGFVKLADLGIAKVLEESDQTDSNLTQPGFVMGTPSFMPPEQFTNSHSVSLTGDIYSMGATLYFLLTAKVPFPGNIYQVFELVSRKEFPDVRKDRPGISPRVAEIIHKCTLRTPGARYADASHLLRALETSGVPRSRLADSETGSVTGPARVSTPPAHRLGKIRIEVPENQTTKVLPEGWGSRLRGRRGALLVVGLLVFAGVFAVGLRLWINQVRDLPENEEARRAEKEGDRAGAREKGPEVSVGRGTSDRSTEARGGESGKVDPSSRPADREQKVAPSPAPPPEDRREKTLELARTKVANGEMNIARSILEAVPDWGPLTPQASRLLVKVYLSIRDPQEAKARERLKEICREPGAHVAGSPCVEAYRDMLAYLAQPPGSSSSFTHEARLNFLDSLGPPLPEPPELLEQHASVKKALVTRYLSAVAAEAESALAREDFTQAAKSLRRPFEIPRQEKLEERCPEDSARLAAILKEVIAQAAQVSAWEALVKKLHPAGTPLYRISTDDVQGYLDQVKSFTAANPVGPRAERARRYEKLYQDELKSR